MSTDFIAAHAEYSKAWAVAAKTGNTEQVEQWMGPDYHGWFATSAQEVHPFDRGAAIDGMRQSVARLLGADIVFTQPVFSRRGADEALVSYQKEIRQRGSLVSIALIHESWMLHGGEWLLEREFTEHGASLDRHPGEQSGT